MLGAVPGCRSRSAGFLTVLQPPVHRTGGAAVDVVPVKGAISGNRIHADSRVGARVLGGTTARDREHR